MGEQPDAVLTFFSRLDEAVEEAPPPTGVLGGLFGRWFRSDSPAASPGPSTAQPSQPSVELQVEADLCTSNGNSHSASNVHPRDGSPGSESRMSFASQDTDTSGTPRRKQSRLAALFRKDRGGLADYNRSNFRQYWMPDSTGKECYQCEEKFNILRRRHHCRLCGQIFCKNCCDVHIPGASLGYLGDLRLCLYCAKVVEQHMMEDESRNSSEDLSAPQPILMNSTDEVVVASSPPALPGIATVSGGSLMWSREDPAPVERRNSLALPPPSYKPPSMLCVQELYMAHNSEAYLSSNAASTNQFAVEEEESAPDWVRNMDLMGHGQYDALKVTDHQSSNKPTVQFDLGPLVIEHVEPLDEPSKAPLERKESLNKRQSLSPEQPEYINENDVDKLFDHRAEMLIEYLLRRQNLDTDRWRDLILKTARNIANTVEVNVFRRKDNMNVLSYVHVKKLVVHEDPSAEVIWGVAFTKAVTHTSMAGELPNASVMLVAGSIEYERVAGKLSNLEPIINQEAEYLSKQVERILSRRPSLLLVENTVSRVAADLLRAAGVRLVVGIKKQVLLRISRATGADLIPGGDAQLIQQNQNVGFCPLFVQREIGQKNGEAKIILVFDQCAPDRGCSVLLRASSLRELRAVKRILQFMILNLYSSNLEKAFLALHNCKLAYQISSCEACELRRENIEEEETGNGFLTELRKSALSASPYVEFEPPFLETPNGKACSLLPYFKQPLYRFETVEQDLEEVELFSNFRPVPVSPLHPFEVSTKAALVVSEESTTSFRALAGAVFRARISRRPPANAKFYAAEAPTVAKREDVLDPFVHQRVAILFGSFSPKSPNAPLLCVRPWVISMQFYAANDMTLGEFLTKYCFNKEYQCPSTNCELSMLEHSRKMVFGRVCVEVTTTQIQQGAPSEIESVEQQRISSYHYCEECKASSPVVYMDVKTWHLSFAKFLDYIANASYSLGTISSPNDQRCQHCFFHQQSHFFSFNNFATCFKVRTFRPFHVQFSPVICNIQPTQVTAKSLEDMVTRTAALAESICAVACERLAEFAQNEQCTQYAGTFHTVLKQLVEASRRRVEELHDGANDVKKIEDSVVPSTSPIAVKANETLMHMRDAIYHLISKWNEQCSVLGASLRAMRKTVEEGGGPAEVADISLERLDDPFPSYLHLSLPLHPRVGVVVRDIQDGRGEYKPDMGSIIAYALSTADYEEGRTRSREAMGDDGVPLNLNSSAVGEEGGARSEHVEIEFQDAQASFYVKAYYAERFRLLRKLLFPAGEEAFVRSLATSTFWTPQGGKSGAFFYRTQDHRFVIKQMSKFEVQSFVKFAPRYFEYIKTAVTEKKLTTLCKVYGVFRVGYKSKSSSFQIKADILVMEYLFYRHNVSQVWDLKGSLRNRLANTGKSSSNDLVLMDENLMKDLWNSQLYVYPHSKAALNQAISNDSHFLSAQHVMDYSLLVGVDETNSELILGIVDYMRTYTLDKKFESWVKIVAVPGAHLPTVISPESYCTRFSEAIDTYFPVVPDQWTGLGSTMSY